MEETLKDSQIAKQRDIDLLRNRIIYGGSSSKQMGIEDLLLLQVT